MRRKFKMLTIRLMLLAVGMLAMSGAALAQFGVSVSFGPPELPVYEQPICPGDGYLWTPGYWAYGDASDGYYWVPGTWVEAPQVGYLWTPGYWGWGGNAFLFHEGYWGSEVGFYGGVSYGFGYFGHGYYGGRWDNGHFAYNRSYSNVNITINRNVYNTTVVEGRTVNRVSFNGGSGGITVRATVQEEAAANQRHIGPVAAQTAHVEAARANPELRANENHGKPPIAATAKPGAFKESGAVAATEGGAVHSAPAASANTNRPPTETARPSAAVHAKDLPPAEHMAAPNSGNAKTDQKYQQQQQKLQTQQVKERQTLQTKQEQDHARLPQKPANEPKQQQLEQQHAQQTTQLQQKHTQQQQQLQQRQQPATHANPPKQGKGNG